MFQSNVVEQQFVEINETAVSKILKKVRLVSDLVSMNTANLF